MADTSKPHFWTPPEDIPACENMFQKALINNNHLFWFCSHCRGHISPTSGQNLPTEDARLQILLVVTFRWVHVLQSVSASPGFPTETANTTTATMHTLEATCVACDWSLNCVCVRAWREVSVCVTQFGKKDLSNDTPIGQNSKRTVRWCELHSSSHYIVMICRETLGPDIHSVILDTGSPGESCCVRHQGVGGGFFEFFGLQPMNQFVKRPN